MWVRASNKYFKNISLDKLLGVTSCDCQANQTGFQKRITCGLAFSELSPKKAKIADIANYICKREIWWILSM